MKNTISNKLQHTAKELTSQSDQVILEDLKANNLTKSAKGTVDDTGKNVKQKSRLNRAILDSQWNKLKPFLEERAAIYEIDPKYTSQKVVNVELFLRTIGSQMLNLGVCHVN